MELLHEYLIEACNSWQVSFRAYCKENKLNPFTIKVTYDRVQDLAMFHCDRTQATFSGRSDRVLAMNFHTAVRFITVANWREEKLKNKSDPSWKSKKLREYYKHEDSFYRTFASARFLRSTPDRDNRSTAMNEARIMLLCSYGGIE